MNKILLIAVAGATVVASANEIVTASSFGWNPTNATKCLQAAFDSGAKKIVVDRQDSPWLVDMVFPRSNTEIVFADGVVVCARPGSMVRTVDNLFRCKGVTNLTLRGEGRRCAGGGHTGAARGELPPAQGLAARRVRDDACRDAGDRLSQGA